MSFAARANPSQVVGLRAVWGVRKNTRGLSPEISVEFSAGPGESGVTVKCYRTATAPGSLIRVRPSCDARFSSALPKSASDL